MRKLAATLIASVAVHGVALAWVISTPKPEPSRVVAAAPAPEELEELTIVDLLPDPPASVPVGSEPATVAPTGTPRRAAVTVSRPAPRAEITPPVTVVTPPTTTVPEPPKAAPPRPTLSMRSKLERPSLAEQLSAEAMGMPAAKPLPNYPGLRNEVALDAARARRAAGDQMAIEEVVGLMDARDAEELKPQKDGTWKSDKKTFVATVAPDGTVKISDKKNLQIHGLSGEFDTTDWIMRNQGMDPYSAEKLRYLDRTRDQRVEIGKAYKKQQLGQSAKIMQANLQRLWSMTTDLAARKQGVFELWDDCAETGEDELVEGATQARALLGRWVQVKLAGANGFTADELSKLNGKRRSKATFDPYH